jgi:molybdenum cofactor cytidylyltransferase
VTSKVGGIVLAAGASARMGRPKALLPWRGSTCVGALASALSSASLPAVVVVAPGAIGEEIARAAGLPAVINPAPERGMSSSLALGAAALVARGFDAAVVAPVDQPEVGGALCAALAGALLAGAAAAVAAHGGAWGHPFALGDLARAARLGAGETARALLSPEEAVRLVEAGPEVLWNLNTPAEYEAAKRAAGF